MLVTMSVGEVWAGDNVIYFCPTLTWPTWTSSEGIKVQINQKGDGYQWVDYAMSLDGKTYNGHNIYKATVVDVYGGLGAVQFHNNSWGRKEQPFGEKQWTNTSVFAGKMWVGSWIDYTFDAPETLYTVTVVNGTPSSVRAGTTTKPRITAKAPVAGKRFDRYQFNGGNYLWGKLNNSSKNNPCVLGDLLGDWREEIVTWQDNGNNTFSLLINATNYTSNFRLPHLMDDPQYRVQIVNQNCCYNQPPHLSFDPSVKYKGNPNKAKQEDEEDPTGIAAPQATSTIDMSAPFFTPQGVRVINPTTPGIYIQAGKKIIIK